MSYNTLQTAYIYFQTRLFSTDWFSATPEQWASALNMAYNAINALNYIGIKASPTQNGEFPREGQTEVPTGILVAECEIAIAYLQGFDPNADPTVRSETISKISVTYNAQPPIYLLAGIPSAVAWANLMPYLRGNESIRLNRVS